MTKDEALKMAIEFMETLTIDIGIKTWNEKHRKQTIQACKEALEQPAQKPLAWTKQSELDKTTTLRSPIVMWKNQYASIGNNVPLYTHPEPSWQGLSDDELDEIVDRLNVSLILHCSIADFVNAINDKLKDKNND